MPRSDADTLHAPAALPPGLARDALQVAVHALDAAEMRVVPAEMAHAQSTVARAYRALGALPAAVAHTAQALRWSRVCGSADLVVDLLCELCDLRVCEGAERDQAEHGSGHAAREAARDLAFEASGLVRRVADSQWEVTVLLRISDLLDRCGDHADATLLQVRALQIISGVPSAEARFVEASAVSAQRQ